MKFKIEANVYENVLLPKLEKIRRKCEKHGIPYECEVKDTVIEEREIRIDGKMVKRMFQFKVLELSGTAEQKGYILLAYMTVHQHGNVLHSLHRPEDEKEIITVPIKFRNTPPVCEHCKSERNRKKLFIVYNKEKNEYLQVGSSCLKEFTGGLDAEFIADRYTDLEDLLNEYSVWNPRETSSCEPMISIKSLIGVSIPITDKLGYTPSQGTGIPTKKLALKVLKARSDREHIEKFNYYLQDEKLVSEDNTFKTSAFSVLDYHLIGKIKDYWLEKEPVTEFISNIQVLLKEEYVSFQYAGFIVYLYEGYRKHMKKENEKKERLSKTQDNEGNFRYYGETGKRYKDISLENVRTITAFPTNYGYTFVYEIIADGHILRWFASSKMDEGDFKKIDFTVKEFTEYKDEKYTLVQRCKFR